MKCIYDIETLLNFFSVTFLNVNTQEVSDFVIHKDRDDSVKLREFLDNCELLIGFNNLDFDYKVIHYFLTETLPKRPDTIARHLYQEAQLIIDSQNEREKVKNVMRWYDIRIPQMDLFKIWHFDNPARMTSLKYLAINMGMESILDMPIPHDTEIELAQIPTILEYNLNDVMVTYELYKRSQSRIELRRKLTEKYGVEMGNFPDPKIGETIVLKKLSEKLNVPMATLKKCRTFRKQLRLSECILPTISFKTDEFKKVLDQFQSMVVTDTRKSSDIIATLDDVPYYFGMGGLHACRSNGVYRNIASCDVGGYYPSLAVFQGFFPQQFGVQFVQVYSEIAKERAMYQKGSEESTGLKLAQNGVFGKSNSEYSPFYDPKFFMQITINGQLLLAMLCERITIMKAGRIITANTDGIELEVLDQEKFRYLCGEWEKKFGLKLEHDSYRIFATRDINNYVAVTTSGKVKMKGAFKTNAELEKDGELHKNFSMDVVKKAVSQYFLNNVPIEDTISKADSKDFLIGDRAKVGSFAIRGLRNGELYNEDLPRHIRYYMSKPGGVLIKKGIKGMNEAQVQKGYQVTMMNQLGEMKGIDKSYYLKESRKLIDSIIQCTK